MSASKVQLWAEVSRLLLEYEQTEIAAVKETIAASYTSLRQQLQALALNTADDEELT